MNTIAIDMDAEMRDAINCVKAEYCKGTYTAAEMLEIGMNTMGKYSRSCTQLEIVAALSVYENNGFCLELFLPTTQDCIDFWKENNFINELDYYK